LGSGIWNEQVLQIRISIQQDPRQVFPDLRSRILISESLETIFCSVMDRNVPVPTVSNRETNKYRYRTNNFFRFYILLGETIFSCKIWSRFM